MKSGAAKEIIIARNGRPAAKLVPIGDKPKGRRLGLLDGQYPDMSLEDFNKMDAEIEAMFELG